MTLERLRRAIARQESIRRARDLAWILFAAFVSAALIMLALVLDGLREGLQDSSPVLVVYSALGLLAMFFAVRLFASARALGRQLSEARRPGALLEETAPNPADSVWSALLPRRTVGKKWR